MFPVDTLIRFRNGDGIAEGVVVGIDGDYRRIAWNDGYPTTTVHIHELSPRCPVCGKSECFCASTIGSAVSATVEDARPTPGNSRLDGHSVDGPHVPDAVGCSPESNTHPNRSNAGRVRETQSDQYPCRATAQMEIAEKRDGRERPAILTDAGRGRDHGETLASVLRCSVDAAGGAVTRAASDDSGPTQNPARYQRSAANRPLGDEYAFTFSRRSN